MVLNFLPEPELRGQTGLLRESLAAITPVGFVWAVIQPLIHVKGLSLLRIPAELRSARPHHLMAGTALDYDSSGYESSTTERTEPASIEEAATISVPRIHPWNRIRGKINRRDGITS
jgi:hypothetical protein